MKSLGSFAITMKDSLDFARASGDHNPLHIDPVAARRTRFGQTLIHGVCGTLKALDLLLEQRAATASLTSLKVKYSKPAVQGQNLAVFCQTSGESTRLEVFADGIRCQIIDATFAATPGVTLAKNLGSRPSSDTAPTCLEQTVDSCKDLHGKVDLVWDQDLMSELFPSATQYLPSIQIAVLLASTQIVGMQCPGLHSIFAQLSVHFPVADPEIEQYGNTQLAYNVLAVDPRIDRVELSLGNDFVQGTLEAFFRSPPVIQASFAQTASLVGEEEFNNQHALVIGASRGLGEIITKVLAAGGATVTMTYAAGREDALQVSHEIGRFRPTPKVFAYNVLDGLPGAELTKCFESVTHIYYLASPVIAKSDSSQWDSRLFARYCNFYIDGLATLLQQVAQLRPNSRELRLFIPSSIFLEQNTKGFDEYVAAKAAAEAYARCFENSHQFCKVIAPRLPRLYTDQTAGIKNIDEQQSLSVIIEQLRLAAGIRTTAFTSAL